MNIETNVEPKWLKNIDRPLELIFRFSMVSTTILFLTFVGIVVFADDDFLGEDDPSRSEWCKEYHPTLSYIECADMAGW